MINFEKMFGLGNSGAWIKLGRGVLGRTMPVVMAMTVLAAIVSGLFAYADPAHLFAFAMSAFIIIAGLVCVAFGWAALFPIEAANEGKEMLQMQQTRMAAKGLGPMLPSSNVADPKSATTRSLGAEIHTTLPAPSEVLSLPQPTLTPKSEPSG